MTGREWYQQMLATPEWKAKRLEVYERDGFSCADCAARGVLIDCHHTYYVANKMPWEYPTNGLETLCRKCHQERHRVRIVKFASQEDADMWFLVAELEAQLTEEALAARSKQIWELEDKDAVWEAEGRFYAVTGEEGKDRFYDEDGNLL